MSVDVPLLISVESLYQFLECYDKIPPVPSSFDSGYEVRHMPIYCFGLCQLRRRLPQRNNLKMAVRMIPHHGLSRQLNLKTRMIKSTLNSMRPQLPPCLDALFVATHSAVWRIETATSNRAFRIRFFAHSYLVPGRVVVKKVTYETTGKQNTQRKEKLLARAQTKYTTRRSL